MVPPLTEEKKDITKYEPKFIRLVRDLPKNRVVIFVNKFKDKKAVLMKEEAFEEIESYLETADVVLNNPSIIKEVTKARREAEKSKPITLDELKDELGL